MRKKSLVAACALFMLTACGNLRHTNLSLDPQDPLPPFTLRPITEPARE